MTLTCPSLDSSRLELLRVTCCLRVSASLPSRRPSPYVHHLLVSGENLTNFAFSQHSRKRRRSISSFSIVVLLLFHTSFGFSCSSFQMTVPLHLGVNDVPNVKEILGFGFQVSSKSTEWSLNLTNEKFET